MIVTTTNTLGDRDIVETVGMVRGCTTWRRRINKIFQGGIRSIQQVGELDFEAALASIKKKAMDEMIAEAEKAGACAIVGLSEQISEVTSGVFMVTVMGTAVRTQPKQEFAQPPAATYGRSAEVFNLHDYQPAQAATAYAH